MEGEREDKGVAVNDEFVYRISTFKEWELLQRDSHIFGGDLDKISGFIHLSTLNPVQPVLQNFFLNTKLGDGLIYERVDDSNSFPHFYGPSRSFSPLPLDAVTKAEKLILSGGRFTCSLLE